jgi:hypothetical protein
MPPGSRKAAILALTNLNPESRRVVLALAMLLFAQFGAQWHAYAHGEPGACEVPRQTTTLASHAGCADCLAYAPLLSSAGTPAQLPHIACLGCRILPSHRLVSLLDQSPTTAFRSRAPPQELPA